MALPSGRSVTGSSPGPDDLADLPDAMRARLPETHPLHRAGTLADIASGELIRDQYEMCMSRVVPSMTERRMKDLTTRMNIVFACEAARKQEQAVRSIDEREHPGPEILPFEISYSAAPHPDAPRDHGLMGCSSCPRGLPWAVDSARADMEDFLRRAEGRWVIFGCATARAVGKKIRGSAKTVVICRHGSDHWGDLPDGMIVADSFETAIWTAWLGAKYPLIPLVGGGAWTIGEAVKNSGCRAINHTQLVPGCVSCAHTEDRVYTPFFGARGLARIGFIPEGPPRILSGGHTARRYLPADGAARASIRADSAPGGPARGEDAFGGAGRDGARAAADERFKEIFHRGWYGTGP